MTNKQRAAISRLIKNYPYSEHNVAADLFNEIGNFKSRKFLTRGELIKILKWKSPRPMQRYEMNTELNVRAITKAAFTTNHEGVRIHTLTLLHGVNYPAASAILMFYDRTRYPVLDIRVWKQLHKIGLVKTNEKGKGFKNEEWLEYLKIFREAAKEFGVPVRHLEKSFFDKDQAEQEGNLY